MFLELNCNGFKKKIIKMLFVDFIAFKIYN